MGLPFTFARRFDILVEDDRGPRAEVIVGPRVTREAILGDIEVRRALRRPIHCLAIYSAIRAPITRKRT